MLVDGLNDRQRNALELMLAGMNDRAIAQQVGVDRRTICRWRHENDAFKEALHERRRELWDGVVDKMRAMLEPSLEVLSEHLHDSLDRNRYRAAVSILRLSNVRGAIPVTDKDDPERARH
jgi:hypothetical protein